MRRLWTEDAVDHDGPLFHLEGIGVMPKPIQKPLDVWMGGIAPSELRRIGRLSDGWLPSFIVPGEAAAAKAVVDETADKHDREIDPEHFGALIAYAVGEVPETLLALLARRRPDLDPDRHRPQRDGRAARPHQRVLRRRLLEVRRAAGR